MRILIADDDAASCEALAEFFRMHEHEVRTAHSGQQALDCAAQFRPHIALLDILMPDMDGFDVAQRLRQALPDSDIRLVALTGVAPETLLPDADASGFEHYFLKPVSPFDILRHVDGRPTIRA